MEKMLNSIQKCNFKSHAIPFFVLLAMLGKSQNFGLVGTMEIFHILFRSVPSFNHHCGVQT